MKQQERRVTGVNRVNRLMFEVIRGGWSLVETNRRLVKLAKPFESYSFKEALCWKERLTAVLMKELLMRSHDNATPGERFKRQGLSLSLRHQSVASVTSDFRLSRMTSFQRHGEPLREMVFNKRSLYKRSISY